MCLHTFASGDYSPMKQGDKEVERAEDRGISNIEQGIMKDEVRGEDRKQSGKDTTGINCIGVVG